MQSTVKIEINIKKQNFLKRGFANQSFDNHKYAKNSFFNGKKRLWIAE